VKLLTAVAGLLRVTLVLLLNKLEGDQQMSQYYQPYANNNKFWKAYEDWDEATHQKAEKLQNRRWKMIREQEEY
jgi:hypothetical protein